MKLKFKLSKSSGVKLPLDLSGFERLDRDQYRLIALGLAAIIVLMVVAGLTAFLLSLKGAEETMVPEVRGVELAQALIKLQEKELYPRVSLRFTDALADRGRIMEQKPLPGTIVKAGRRIQLVVSRGPVVDHVENYIGQDLNDVKIHLQTLFPSSRPLLTIKEPPTYKFDASAAGTILEQKPLPDTEISEPIALDLVVSRGPEKAQLLVPELRGLPFSDALAQIQKAGVPTVFTMRKADGREKAGVVASQTPVAGSSIPQTARLAVTVTSPIVEKGMVAGVFERELQEYPYPLRVSVEVLLPSGERQTLISINHPGGDFSIPYYLPEGSMLVLKVLDREVARMELKSQ